jgi:hypothetical protein
MDSFGRQRAWQGKSKGKAASAATMKRTMMFLLFKANSTHGAWCISANAWRAAVPPSLPAPAAGAR